MKKGELDRALLEMYRSAPYEEDSLEDLLLLLQSNPKFLLEIFHEWFEDRMKNYLYLRAINFPVPFAEEFLVVGKIMPNLFADAARLAFAPPDLNDDIEEEKISAEEEIKNQQDWLQNTLPEIFEDVQAEQASAKAQLNSEEGKKRTEAFVDRFVSRHLNLPDPNDPS